MSLAGSVALATAAVVAIGPRRLLGGYGVQGEIEAVPSPSSVARPAPAPAPSPAPPAADERGLSAEAVKKPHVLPAPRAPAASAGPRAAALANPAPVDRNCVPRALRTRRDLGSRLPPEISVRFRVDASGAVGRIEVLGDVRDREVAEAIEDAVRSCPFVPGSDEGGRPIPLPVVMRVRFAPAGASSGF